MLDRRYLARAMAVRTATSNRALVAAVAFALSCGARSELRAPDVPDVGLVDEICGNGRDDNRDGRIDENCTPCISAGVSPWQQFPPAAVVCFDRRFESHGDPGEYAFSRVPPVDDPRWMSRADLGIDFSDPSRLCNAPCTCRDGGDFTYFQTFIRVPRGFTVRTLEVSIERIDDGAALSVAGPGPPYGTLVTARTFAPSRERQRIDIASLITEGSHRVVLTHVDDCCRERVMLGVEIRLNGGALTQCP